MIFFLLFFFCIYMRRWVLAGFSNLFSLALVIARFWMDQIILYFGQAHSDHLPKRLEWKKTSVNEMYGKKDKQYQYILLTRPFLYAPQHDKFSPKRKQFTFLKTTCII